MSRFALGFMAPSPVGNDAFTKILLHMDGANAGTTFTDDNAGGSAHAWTAHSATTDTGTVKFGTASLNCGAAAGSIDTPDSADYTLGSGDWTVDFWFNVSGGPATVRRGFGQADVSFITVSIGGGLNTLNAAFIQAQVGATFFTVQSTTTYTTPGWHHYAAVRTGNILRLFVDGVQEGGDLAITGTVNDSSSIFGVGKQGALASQFWNGFVDEFRLSVGIARWTANFTPPVFPYA